MKPWLVLLALAAGVDTISSDAPPPSAATAFERLKSLAGEWDSYSSKEWSGRVTLSVIARGSAIVATTHFEKAHPRETMLTVFHVDSGRLMLTHYCVAKNQPRLEATSISLDSNTLSFTFRDATNLADRDVGHMDKVIFRIDGPDRYTSRWTWYQDGKERWMEEIRHERRKASTAAP